MEFWVLHAPRPEQGLRRELHAFGAQPYTVGVIPSLHRPRRRLEPELTWARYALDSFLNSDRLTNLQVRGEEPHPAALQGDPPHAHRREPLLHRPGDPAQDFSPLV